MKKLTKDAKLAKLIGHSQYACTSSTSGQFFLKSSGFPLRHAWRHFSDEGRRQQVLAKLDGFVPIYRFITAK